ncbi:hypothetical protein MRX96_009669 [Rhipicephalus microplus]
MCEREFARAPSPSPIEKRAASWHLHTSGPVFASQRRRQHAPQPEPGNQHGHDDPLLLSRFLGRQARGIPLLFEFDAVDRRRQARQALAPRCHLPLATGSFSRRSELPPTSLAQCSG